MEVVKMHVRCIKSRRPIKPGTKRLNGAKRSEGRSGIYMEDRQEADSCKADYENQRFSSAIQRKIQNELKGCLLCCSIAEYLMISTPDNSKHQAFLNHH